MSKKKTITCQRCKQELSSLPKDCEFSDCPYKEEDSSFFEDLLDVEVTINGETQGCLGFGVGDGGGCLWEMGGCLLMPFRLLFNFIVGFFKVIGKILSVFDD